MPAVCSLTAYAMRLREDSRRGQLGLGSFLSFQSTWKMASKENARQTTGIYSYYHEKIKKIEKVFFQFALITKSTITEGSLCFKSYYWHW